MHDVEVAVKMFQTKIDVINLASTSRVNVWHAKDRVCVLSPAIWGHRSAQCQERLYKADNTEAYKDCMGTRSTATALQ